MEKVNLNLTDNQKAKLKSAFKNKNSVTVQFGINQFKNDGMDSILLSQRQLNRLEKHKKLNKGLRYEFSYNQLKQIKNGGLLNEILNVADYIPGINNFTPKVRKGAKMIKEDVIPKFKSIINWLDNELANVQGSGLDENTLKHVKENFKKNFSH